MDRFFLCRGRESDPRPSDYEPLALPLSYLGMGFPLSERRKYYYSEGLLSTPGQTAIWRRSTVRPPPAETA